MYVTQDVGHCSTQRVTVSELLKYKYRSMKKKKTSITSKITMITLVSRKMHSLNEGCKLKIKFIGNVQFSLPAPGDSVSSGS